MRITLKIIMALLVIILSLFLFSCQFQRKAEMDPLKQSHINLAKGDYQKSINVYKTIYAKYPEDRTLLSSYVKMIEDIKKTADNAFGRKDFALAIRIYNILLNNFSDFEEFNQFLSFDRASLNMMIQKCDINIIYKIVNRHTANNNFQRALDAYEVIRLKYPKDSILLQSYVKAIENIKNRADMAFKKKDFTSSGKIYNILLSNYSRFNDAEQFLSFDSKFLNASITDCSKFLTKKGLEQYRMGNFSQAISIWENILLFDSDNVEIRKAVDTASLQLKNLQQKE